MTIDFMHFRTAVIQYTRRKMFEKNNGTELSCLYHDILI